MDDFGLLLKGGKNGKIIQPGDASSSEMMVRILLPGNDDKHMPPKGKKQLTENEIALFFDDWRRGLIDNDEAVKMEKQIHAAIAAGRIR
jgi:hypothetical protein